MYPISTLVKESVPNYLQSLPIPDSIGGWFRLGIKDWVSLVPFFAAVGGAGYAGYRLWGPRPLRGDTARAPPVNPDVKKEEAKVVECVNIEDLGEKTAYCRCWRSKKFPYCDGAHGKYNREHGDNVGPLVITRAKAS